MTSQAQTAKYQHDRNFFLIYLVLIWIVTTAGFGLDILVKFDKGTLHYPLIVHAHAIVFVAWLALLTSQIVLIRIGNQALHRRLGIIAVVLIPLMAFLAIATVIITKTLQYGHPDTSFPFMAAQFANVLASTVLFIAGLSFRRTPATHKRLMLMGTLMLTVPGIRRIVGYALNGNFHVGFLPFMVESYGGTILLMLGLGAYDLVTRRRLYPAYVLALTWCLTNQLVATWLYYQPWWSHYTTHLVGH